jgi:hypothetical protein
VRCLDSAAHRNHAGPVDNDWNQHL